MTKSDLNNEKNLIIIPEEAAIVKEIFELYVQDVGTNEIGRIMQNKGYLTRRKGTKWYNSTIEGIITNEKYCGDLLLQKSVTIDFLNHKRVKNEGIEEQVYIKNNHEPIVSREIWEKAQLIYARNREKFRGTNPDSRKYASQYPLSGMLVCLECGDTFKRRHWTQGYATPRIMFQCNGYVLNYAEDKCGAKPISEDIVLKTTVEVINRVYFDKGKALTKLMNNIALHTEAGNIQEQIDDLKREKESLEDEISDVITKKQNTMDEIEKIVLEKQYKERIIDYRELDMKISDLECKARETELSKLRLLDMSKNIGGQRLTVETLTKPIVNTCLQAIIVVNRHELVFVLPNNEKANYLYIKEKRASLVQHTPLLEGDVTLERRYRNEHLHYKVVMV